VRVHAIEPDGVQCNAANDSVIAMRDPEVVGAPRVVGDEQIGLEATDKRPDVTAQIPRILDFAVWIS
jgi:hypothetical protein